MMNEFNKIDKMLFWDADFNKLSLKKDYFYIINRIIMRGDQNDRRIMFSLFSLDQIEFSLKNSREVPKHFKDLLLEIVDEKRSC